jgi:hypothetical protein
MRRSSLLVRGPVVRFLALVMTVAVLNSHLAFARAWSVSELLYAESTMYMADGSYFSSLCHLTNPRSTTCNPDQLFSRSESRDLDLLVQRIARGADPYALPGLKPPRGRYIAVLVMREISASSVTAFAAQVHQQWALLKCGQPQWSGCSNSVVLVVATDQKAVCAYAGESSAADQMAHELMRIEESMAARMSLWRDDALSR